MFDLTIHQCDAGPGKRKYEFETDGVELVVEDVSNNNTLNGGRQAILISFGAKKWVYQFDSGKYPPQEPRLLISKNNDLSIQGEGKVVVHA